MLLPLGQQVYKHILNFIGLWIQEQLRPIQLKALWKNLSEMLDFLTLANHVLTQHIAHRISVACLTANLLQESIVRFRGSIKQRITQWTRLISQLQAVDDVIWPPEDILESIILAARFALAANEFRTCSIRGHSFIQQQQPRKRDAMNLKWSLACRKLNWCTFTRKWSFLWWYRFTYRAF